MLDQNVTTLLSTLLGGILTIAGGFIATYYTLRKNSALERKKDLRGAIENIYGELHKLDVLSHHLTFAVENPVLYTREDYSIFQESMGKIDFLISLYIPELISEYRVYISVVNSAIQRLYDKNPGEIEQKDRKEVNEILNQSHIRFRTNIIEIAKKKHFNSL
jgi:hypothetical protein